MERIAAKIVPCLWYDGQAEQAAEHYTSIFEDSRIVQVQYTGQTGPGEPGTVLVVRFRLAGTEFVALNGGPMFHFTEAVSFQIACDTQDEVDRLWEKLGEGGEFGPCGWLKDKFGLSWQVTPVRLFELLIDSDADRADRVTRAMLDMGKLDIATLENA
ncbi:VOC family protein [Saccharopolyspora sp. HNM0983]|uniref:VOC family protein n=1 Tax=Saccharopolyspora montiporae TaxID=2781240 RepID=A0A929B8Y5_9PSEU|nr:VOC family protein [Saccharopolyspora sp. HNM0983]MBE9373353.1 VOC family protein [Saccharopolyspora sp. HNM0983]